MWASRGGATLVQLCQVRRVRVVAIIGRLDRSAVQPCRAALQLATDQHDPIIVDSGRAAPPLSVSVPLLGAIRRDPRSGHDSHRDSRAVGNRTQDGKRRAPVRGHAKLAGSPHPRRRLHPRRGSRWGETGGRSGVIFSRRHAPRLYLRPVRNQLTQREAGPARASPSSPDHEHRRHRGQRSQRARAPHHDRQQAPGDRHVIFGASSRSLCRPRSGPVSRCPDELFAQVEGMCVVVESGSDT